MTLFDLPLAELERYCPPRDEPADFDEFWSTTLAEQDSLYPLTWSVEPVDTGLVQVVTEDVTFTGFGGQEVKAWLHRPSGDHRGLGAVVSFIGYGGGRGLSHEGTLLAQAGYAVLVMDNRGQGSSHRVGHTGDDGPTGASFPGFLTRGIDSPQTYYYRRLFVDAVRAVEVVRRHPAVDPARVMVNGASQGGAIALAAAALSPGLRGAVVDVPFLTHVRRACEVTDAMPYGELITYLHVHRDREEQVFETLSYFDGVNFAARLAVPTMFSVGLRDAVCPPSAVYAAHNACPAPKEMKVYAYNGHEHGGPFQEVEHVRFAHEVLAER